jgi:MFS family permease
MVRTIVGLIATVTFFGIAYVTLLPAWAVRMLSGDAKTNGFLFSARGLGALTGALIIASLGRFNFRGKLLTAGTIVMPIVLLVFSFVRSVPLSLLLLFGAGLSMILIFNLCNALVQTFAPNELRGRVMSVYSLVFFGSMPIAALGIGWTAHLLGEQAAVIIGASIMFLASGLVFLFFPQLRRQA